MPSDLTIKVLTITNVSGSPMMLLGSNTMNVYISDNTISSR